jgi:hypothetical protein
VVILEIPRKPGRSIRSMLGRIQALLRKNTQSARSTPRPHGYIGTIMEQSQGLSMVNSKISTQYIVTTQSYPNCHVPPTLSTQD